MDDLLCRALATCAVPRELTAEEIETLWAAAKTNHVAVLLAAILSGSDRVSARLNQEVSDCLADAEIKSLLRQRELVRVLDALALAKVDALLVKGAGVAYTIYSDPCLRPSCDVDLFIRREALDAVAGALAACGYERTAQPDAEFAAAQRAYVRTDRHGRNQLVDVHWRLSNARIFADALTFDEAWQASEAVPAVAPTARTLGAADALSLACIHRVAHHHDAPELRWLWDVHLLGSRLTAAEWRRFTDRAEQHRLRAISARGLQLAHDRFGTQVPADVLDRLTAPGPSEPTAEFVGGPVRMVHVVGADLAATKGCRNRATLVREHLFPPAGYMRSLYPRCPERLLAAAYVDRILRGAPKWFLRRSP